MKFKKEQLLLYAVTDRAWTKNQSLYEQIEQALDGGVTCVQLREKNMDDDMLIKETLAVKRLCRRYGVPLIINDRADIALKTGADGVHVGHDDCAVSEIRKKAGKDFIIGATAKTPQQALCAQQDGADYIGVGAVFPSPTKKNAIRITTDELKKICSSVSLPAVAIGGIELSNISTLAGCKINGIAVVSALFSAEDIKSAAKSLKAEAIKVAEFSSTEC
jgi:thiamine-phosphate pyrophosphorylase